ncbi:hypothetical protein ACVWZR_007150 [Bradyrhizobium sp. i1.3.1]
MAASTHDANTDGIGASGESPDHGKIGTNGGRDTSHDGHEQTLLAGGSRDDHFVFASTSNSSAARPDIISGFKADSERGDLIALGALTLSVLALDPSSTTVPAHTIAWLYDSSANQTIVYVNPTDQSLSIGDSSLVESPSRWLLHRPDVGFHARAGNVGSCDGSRAGQSRTGRGQRRDR